MHKRINIHILLGLISLFFLQNLHADNCALSRAALKTDAKNNTISYPCSKNGTCTTHYINCDVILVVQTDTYTVTGPWAHICPLGTGWTQNQGTLPGQWGLTQGEIVSRCHELGGTNGGHTVDIFWNGRPNTAAYAGTINTPGADTNCNCYIEEQSPSSDDYELFKILWNYAPSLLPQ